VNRYLSECVGAYRRQVARLEAGGASSSSSSSSCPLSSLTSFDLQLFNALGSVLHAHEAVRTLHGSNGKSLPVLENLFQEAIRNICGENRLFKGCPLHFPHCNPSMFFPAMLEDPACRDVLKSSPSGRGVRFAVRCRISNFPEDVRSTWVLLAVLLPLPSS